MSTWKPHPAFEIEDKTPLHKILVWAKGKQEIIAVSFLVVLLVSVGIPYYLKSKAESESTGMQKLNVAQYYLTSHVDPKNGPFKSDREKYQAALQQFQQVAQQNAGTYAAKAAKYYEGKCQLVMGQYAQAYVSFDEAAQRLKDSPLGEAALLGKASSLVMQVKWADAAKVYEQYTVQYPAGFLIGEMRLHLADTYIRMNQKDKAVAEWRKVAEMDPKSADGLEAIRLLKQKS